MKESPINEIHRTYRKSMELMRRAETEHLNYTFARRKSANFNGSSEREKPRSLNRAATVL